MKNVAECQEDFFAYLNSLETYDDRLKSCTYNEKEKRKSLDKTDPHVLVQLLVGGGGIFLLKSYNTREHSVCGLAKLIWRASEDTKYMARKKGGDTIIWNSYCPRKRPTTPRRHRGGTAARRRRVVKASSSIGRGCAQNYTSLMSFCNSRTGTLRGIGGVHILIFEYVLI